MFNFIVTPLPILFSAAISQFFNEAGEFRGCVTGGIFGSSEVPDVIEFVSPDEVGRER